PATAQGPPAPTRPRPPPRDARQWAIVRGLDYLASNQATDGSIGKEAGRVGITSLAVLAFMAQGHEEGRGRYANWRGADVLRRGVDYLLSRSLQPGSRVNPEVSGTQGMPTGYVYDPNDADSQMHGHGYATQVLILAYGTSKRDTARAARLRIAVQRAVNVIENSQTITGGWGYKPNRATTHEGSITVTVVQALRLAAGAGFVVDKRVRDKGLKYLRNSQKRDGSFKYSITSDSSTAALTAAAMTAMQGFGEYYSESIQRGLDYLRRRYRDTHNLNWPFYARYYAAQSFYRAEARDWTFWTREIVPRFLREQERGGFWDDQIAHTARRGSHGRAYATALTVLALSVPDGYLPLFQR
ncbi:MAG: terpene cyclase/mutase family protein, partial [Planctomycetota bacterium]|nr:terpene cyclase/mutase family protein [Planctomycetota bacterium]